MICPSKSIRRTIPINEFGDFPFTYRMYGHDVTTITRCQASFNLVYRFFFFFKYQIESQVKEVKSARLPRENLKLYNPFDPSSVLQFLRSISKPFQITSSDRKPALRFCFCSLICSVGRTGTSLDLAQTPRFIMVSSDPTVLGSRSSTVSRPRIDRSKQSQVGRVDTYESIVGSTNGLYRTGRRVLDIMASFRALKHPDERNPSRAHNGHDSGLKCEVRRAGEV